VGFVHSAQDEHQFNEQGLSHKHTHAGMPTSNRACFLCNFYHLCFFLELLKVRVPPEQWRTSEKLYPSFLPDLSRIMACTIESSV